MLMLNFQELSFLHKKLVMALIFLLTEWVRNVSIETSRVVSERAKVWLEPIKAKSSSAGSDDGWLGS